MTTLSDNEYTPPDADAIRQLRGGLDDLIELFDKHARKLAGAQMSEEDRWAFNDRPYEGDHARATIAVDALVQHARRARWLVDRVEAAFASLGDVGYIMNRNRRGKTGWQGIVDVAVKWMDERLKQ